MLVGVALAGGVPLLTFDLAPDPSSVVAGAFTSTVFPLVVIGVWIAQFVVLGRIGAGDPAASGGDQWVLDRAGALRVTAGALALACALAAAAFLVEELHRIATGGAGEYWIVPFALLVAVVAAGLPYSWIVAAIAFVTLVAQPMASLGPASAGLDATAVVAVALPAVINCVRTARIALSERQLDQRVLRYLGRRRPRLPSAGAPLP